MFKGACGDSCEWLVPVKEVVCHLHGQRWSKKITRGVEGWSGMVTARSYVSCHDSQYEIDWIASEQAVV